MEIMFNVWEAHFIKQHFSSFDGFNGNIDYSRITLYPSLKIQPAATVGDFSMPLLEGLKFAALLVIVVLLVKTSLWCWHLSSSSNHMIIRMNAISGLIYLVPSSVYLPNLVFLCFSFMKMKTKFHDKLKFEIVQTAKIDLLDLQYRYGEYQIQP